MDIPSTGAGPSVAGSRPNGATCSASPAEIVPLLAIPSSEFPISPVPWMIDWFTRVPPPLMASRLLYELLVPSPMISLPPPLYVRVCPLGTFRVTPSPVDSTWRVPVLLKAP